MARIEVATHIEASPEHVWGILTRWEDQSRWMRDARSVTVLSPHREGVDVVVRCMTRLVDGITVTDDLVTTQWEEPSTLAVRHLGWLIRGDAAFELEAAAGGGTDVVWWEDIDPPGGAIGEALARRLAVPAVTRLFRGSLADLKQLCESGGIRP